MPTTISEVQVVSSVMPMLSHYGNFMYVDKLYNGPVPATSPASAYNHKYEKAVATTSWTFPNLTGWNDDYNYKTTNLSGTLSPTSGNVISHFYTKSNAQSWYDKMITEECPLTGNEGVITFDPLLSGVVTNSPCDTERKWFAYIDCYQTGPGSYRSEIYGIGAYGKFDADGKAVYPSGIQMHTIYRYIYLYVFFDDDKWKVRELYAAPYFVQQQGSHRNTMAQNTVLTGWVNVSSGRRYEDPNLGHVGDYTVFPTDVTDAGRFMNVYRNTEITSGTSSIDWNEGSYLMSYPWSRIFCKLNDGSVLKWKQRYSYENDSARDNEWEVDPDRILSLSGADSGWTIELEDFIGGNVFNMLDFRNQNEFDNCFLANQIDIMQIRTGISAGNVYGYMIFKNENFLSGIWTIGSSSRIYHINRINRF